MEWITWGDSLRLGHEEIDDDHQKLVAIVNRLADSVMSPSAQQTDEELLAEFLTQTVAHFAEEDRLMAAHHYPRAEEHAAEHARLIQAALDARAEFAADLSTSVSLLRFLRRWLTHHILTADKELEDYLGQR